MKRFFVLFLFAALSGASFAQNNNSVTPASPAAVSADVAREATDLLVVKYSLNPDQAKQMYGIQERKQRNLAAIKSLETTNLPQYRSKLASIQKGTLASIRRILRTEAQVKLYQQTQTTVRTQKAEKRKEMLLQQKPEAEIEAAMLLIYAE